MKKLAFLLFFALATPMLQADIIYSNLGGSPAFDPSVGNAVAAGGTDFGISFSFFVPSSSYQLTAVDFAAVVRSAGAVNTITATIYNDNGGVPGSAVYTVTDPLPTPGGSSTELFNSLANGPILVGGGTYWVGLDAPLTSNVAWSYNGLNLNGPASTFVNGNWTTPSSRQQGAFELDGAIVSPEPMTTALFASGLAAFAMFRRPKAKKN